MVRIKIESPEDNTSSGNSPTFEQEGVTSNKELTYSKPAQFSRIGWRTFRDPVLYRVSPIHMQENPVKDEVEPRNSDQIYGNTEAAANSLPDTPDMDESPQLLEDYKRMHNRLKTYCVKERRKIDEDGNCQFAAVSDQIYGHPRFHGWIRQVVSEWLRNHPDFPVGENVVLSDFLETDCYPTWDVYCDYMSQEGSWGDQITLRAIAELFNVEITIISSVYTNDKGEPVTIIRPSKGAHARSILLSHWHERHYGSLCVDSEM